MCDDDETSRVSCFGVMWCMICTWVHDVRQMRPSGQAAACRRGSVLLLCKLCLGGLRQLLRLHSSFCIDGFAAAAAAAGA
jgi:hypothetical protein